MDDKLIVKLWTNTSTSTIRHDIVFNNPSVVEGIGGILITA
jgi:hypothetical protein